MWKGSVDCLHGLLAVLPEIPQHQTHGGRSPALLQKQILLTLCNPQCLQSVADRFDITKLSEYHISSRICKAIACKLFNQFTDQKFPCAQPAWEAMDKSHANCGCLRRKYRCPKDFWTLKEWKGFRIQKSGYGLVMWLILFGKGFDRFKIWIWTCSKDHTLCYQESTNNKRLCGIRLLFRTSQSWQDYFLWNSRSLTSNQNSSNKETTTHDWAFSTRVLSIWTACKLWICSLRWLIWVFRTKPDKCMQ